ncbi:MAG: hypothetical protein A3F74_10330 [Betaproteobacteria bacterium RIFCSPLOWO2_12_FULL_62_58]|nr:MAG: hypothetical protein A3F74_10330 [Betaproteobacteria bacterium RIFCSPLOWO2_12_FULL_62_58]
MLSFSVGNIEIEIQSLSSALDEAFVQLYSSRLGSAVLHQSVFDDAASAFLRSTPDPGKQDQYFSNFTPLWNLHLRAGNLRDAAAVWPWALRPVANLEAQGSSRIHKGSAYYFWGMTALLADDLDRGYLLMHRGLEEDVLTHGVFDPKTPGFALAILDNEKPDQAFRPWVQHQAAAVISRIERYCTRYARSFDLAGLRSRVLALPELRDAAFLYSYAMARAARLLAIPEQLWLGPFPAQLAFDIIFDLCLVVDSAIHYKNPGADQFILHATLVAQKAGLGLSQDDLGKYNGLFKSDFKGALNGALAETLGLPGKPAATDLAAAILVTYACRNRGAHNVTFVHLDPGQFDALIDRLTATLCLVAEVLY